MKRIRGKFHPQTVLRVILKISGFTVSLILLGLIIAYFALDHTRQPQTTQILIAGRSIPAQDPVDAEHLATYAMPENQVPPNSITSDEVEQYLGLETIHPLQKGDIIQRSVFGIQDDGRHDGIATVIPPDKQIAYLRFSEVYVFPPDIQKNTYLRLRAVDLETNTSSIILQAVQVFDIYRTIVDEEEQIVMISFLLTEADTKRLSSYLNDRWQIYLTMLSNQPERESVPATGSGTLDLSQEAAIGTDSSRLQIEPNNEDQ